MDAIYVTKATTEHAQACDKIARQFKNELGFVRRDNLLKSTERGYLHVALIDGEVAGFVEFNRPTRGANKGFTVVYHLAVGRGFQRRDIGRKLLYSVPHPVRLKCTVDNPANDFYRASGMTLIATEAGKKRALNVWERRVLCIWVQGNNRDIPALAKGAGMAYGTRHDMKARADVVMLDIKWDKYDWSQYLDLVRQHRPVFAMVADYECIDQRETMLKQVDDLHELGVLNIMVCPKFDNAISDIPADCVIAVSVPSRYAGFLPNFEELAGRRVHLLGGAPVRQMPLIRQIAAYGGLVASLDGNAHQKNAIVGMEYTKEGVWYRPAAHRNQDKQVMLNLCLSSAQAICTVAERSAQAEQIRLI